MNKRAPMLTTITAVFLLLGLFLNGCGSSGGLDDVSGDGTGNGTTTPQISYSSGDACLAPFRASGGLTFTITHAEGCLYRFDLLDMHTQAPYAFLARGTGAFNGAVTVSVPEGDYELRVDSACSWSVTVVGDMEKYACPGADATTTTDGVNT